VPPPPARSVQVKIETTPSDATVTLDGKPVGATTPPLQLNSTHRISVSRLGYQTIENNSIKVNGKDWAFPLQADPLQLSVSISENDGTVWLDDQQVDKLADGSWSSSYPLKSSQEHHVLVVKDKRGESIFKIGYSAVAGQPAVVDPVETKDLVVTSSLGKNAVVYSGNSGNELVFPDQQRKPIPADGLTFQADDSSGTFGIASGNKVNPLNIAHGAAPELSVTLNAVANVVKATVSVTPKNAKLFVDGGLIPHPHNGVYSWMATARTYQAKLTADGMDDLTFSIPLKKGQNFSHHYDMKPKAAAPKPATLIITGGEPGANVSILDGPAIGELDSKGNGKFTYSPGTYTIELAKPGYNSNNFVVTLVSGKDVEPRGEKKLKPATGFVRIVSIKPAEAVVTYSIGGQSHKVTDPNRTVLPPGAYEFTADAPKYLSRSFEVKVQANQVQDISFDLKPVEDSQPVPFVSPEYAKKVNGDWYHGLKNGFLPLSIHFKTNSILFLKDSHVKKMSWRVFLNEGNMITYTLDNKQMLTVVRRLDGQDAPLKVRDLDWTSTASQQSYAVQIRIEKNAITVASQKGAVVPTLDEKHDWSHAEILVKGDTYFTVWPGR
jgi:hypothetical protein